MKKGLVLEGGAMRGLFSAGIIDRMMEENIEFDGLIGVSAGACFGCNYKSRQIGRTLRYNLKYSSDKRYCSVRSLIKTGNLYGAEFCYHTLPEKLDVFDGRTFEENPMEFYLVCTDVETGLPVYHKMEKQNYEELEWMRASASLPLVSRIVEVSGKKLLDGGISDSIPLEFFQGIGYEKNVVVLTQPRGYIKNKSGLMPVVKMALRKYPKIVDAMLRRHEMYNKTLDYVWQEEKKGNTLVLCPVEKLPIKRTEHRKEVLQVVYGMGKAVFDKRAAEIRDFLK